LFIIAKSSFSSENDVRNEAKRSKKKRKRPKEVKKRGYLIEKQKAHEKIGQQCFKSNRTTQKFGKHTRMPVIIGEN
jgi:hypothetical protein